MAKPVIPTTNDDGAQRSIETPEPERLRKVPGVVTPENLAIIRRAVTLQLATTADLDDDSPESTGRAIAAICRTYLIGEVSLRHAYESSREQEQRSGKGGERG